MGKINKFSNLYDKNGKLIKEAELKPYTIEELEALVDKLGDDKDEEGKIKDPAAYNNAAQMLFHLYLTKGNPHKDELLERVKSEAAKKTAEETIEKALKEVEESVDNDKTDEYVDYEEVKEEGKDDNRES